MAGIIEGYNDGWGLLDTPGGKAIAEEYEKQNDPRYQDKKWIKDYIDSQMPAAPVASQAQPMAPVDFTNAPGWWGKGNTGTETPVTSESGGNVNNPQTPQLPVSGGTSNPRMINILGDTGGMTGLVGQRALSNALRSGGQ